MRLKYLLGIVWICAGCAGSVSEQQVNTTTETGLMRNDVTQDSVVSQSSADGVVQKDSQPDEENIQIPVNQEIEAIQAESKPEDSIQTPEISEDSNPSANPLEPEQTDSGTGQTNNAVSAVEKEAESGSSKTSGGESNAAPLVRANPSADAIKKLHTNAEWFEPASSDKWYKQAEQKANKTYLAEYLKLIGYKLPNHAYALIAPIQVQNNKLMMQYYSYNNTAFEYSMTPDGEENYWPASTVKLAACVMALLKMHEYGASSQAVVNYTNVEGTYNNTVEKLCREAIIPSNNASYNRLMEIAGFDEINDHYLPKVFHFPKMILQRRYVRRHPDDSLRISPEIKYTEGSVTGTIPERHSSGKMREQCPRESNCTTLAELAEVMFRTVLHEELPKERRLDLPVAEIDRVRDALKKAPSCIGDGVSVAMGKSAIVYNKGGKVTADDRLEVAVVSSPDKKERYLIALSMPYYVGVERETNRLAMYLIEAMQERNARD